MINKYRIDGKEKEILDRLLNYKQFQRSTYIADKIVLNKKSTALKHIPETKLTIENGWLQGRFVTGKVELGDKQLTAVVPVFHRSQILKPFLEYYSLVERDQIKIKDRRKRVSSKPMFIYRLKRDKETFANVLLRYLNIRDWNGFVEFTYSDYYEDNQKILKELQKEFESIVKGEEERKAFWTRYLANLKGFKKEYEKQKKLRDSVLNPEKGGRHKPTNPDAAGGTLEREAHTIYNISQNTLHYNINIPPHLKT